MPSFTLPVMLPSAAMIVMFAPSAFHFTLATSSSMQTSAAPPLFRVT